MEKLRKKLLALAIGKTFRVKTENERVLALQIAKMIGVPIRTRQTKAGFEVTRVLQ